MSEVNTKKGTGSLAPRYSDPFQVLRGEMDQLFDSFLGGGFPTPRMLSRKNALVPHLDVKENDTAILIEAELPGLAEGDVDLTLQDGILSITGEKKFEQSEEKDNYHVMERRYGSFQRMLRMPDTVDDEKVEAKFDKGILKVILPKKPEAIRQPRKIDIKTG
ncbi:MAG: Hsp20/alpha crystallin family protein [Alphaproteobacteria bacterium]